MEVENGLPPYWTKADATRWGCKVAWDHRKDIVQPALRQRPPMAVRGGPRDIVEVAMDLKQDQIRAVVCNLGRSPGIEDWVGKPAPEALTTTTVWMNLPAELIVTTANRATTHWRPKRIVVSV